MESREYALVEIEWLPLPATLRYPTGSEFAGTGYRQADGPDGIFSVYVKILDGEAAAGGRQEGKLYALVSAMSERLPTVGTNFVLSTGTTVIANCKTRERGEELVDQ